MLLRSQGSLGPPDSKSYRRHRFLVPEGSERLWLSFSYDPGGETPKNLLTLTLLGPGGFRGAAHRFAPRQTIELDERWATPGFLPGRIPPGEWTAEIDVHAVVSTACRYELTVEAS